ncbi:MAG: leucine dehydrogenase [Xanthomonadales bacterium]|nr:leucine dehydrogenase [Xanthomonadales bacterium]MDH4020127.1 leucine dehydrogenase [Xanthomonadales bacterium]
MTFFENPENRGHESIHQFCDAQTGLIAIIAIHSTALGPAAGGCRMWRYDCEADATRDALRLARGMTYKNAMAGLPLGGGKAVILTDPASPPTDETFRTFGRFVDSLGGRYITAEDVGISVDNMRLVQQVTPFVAGLPPAEGSAGGDPSPWTADGVFLGLCAAVKHRLGADSMDKLRVAVQGVGKVGYDLCRQLHAAGATLVISDVNDKNLERAQADFGARLVTPENILFEEVDVLAPCALGAVLNADSIPRIKAAVIGGAANNQLATEEDGKRLFERNILYAPDYVINGGGIISVSLEYMGDKTEADTRAQIALIPGRLTGIFVESEKQQIPTNEIADSMAEAIVAAAAAQP